MSPIPRTRTKKHIAKKVVNVTPPVEVATPVEAVAPAPVAEAPAVKILGGPAKAKADQAEKDEQAEDKMLQFLFGVDEDEDVPEMDPQAVALMETMFGKEDDPLHEAYRSNEVEDLSALWESAPDVSAGFDSSRVPVTSRGGGWTEPAQPGEGLYQQVASKLSVALADIQREETYYVPRQKDLHSVVNQPNLLAGLSRLLKMVERSFKIQTYVYDTGPVLLRVRGNKIALDAIAGCPDSQLVLGVGPDDGIRQVTEEACQVMTMKAYRAKNRGLEAFEGEG